MKMGVKILALSLLITVPSRQREVPAITAAIPHPTDNISHIVPWRKISNACILIEFLFRVQ